MSAPAAPQGRVLAGLCLAALGVVYGDIGTSPLYALKECFSGPHGLEPTREHVLAILSLCFWSLTLVVGVKYIGHVMRADNRGEGGILSLMALARPGAAETGRRRYLVVLALIGAALLYGDGMITPAISVLGAMEGLAVASKPLEPLVLPVSCAILVGLFLLQRVGTAGIGFLFGPVMLVWFSTLTATGVAAIGRAPEVLWALSPTHAVGFLVGEPVRAFVILGSVVLAVTGAEALYADMGHLGKRPIQLTWFSLVFPALMINYLGQGALVLRDPAAAANPFFALVSGTWQLPLVVLATLAAIVASQAMISGAFSLTQQAVQLGYAPRVTIVHTSKTEKGQIYIPEVNTALMVACLALVLAFRSTSSLASAYGIAVTGTFIMTTLLLFRVMRDRWGWSRRRALLVCVPLLLIDAGFFGANVLKIPTGGWFPLVVGVVVFTMMFTWKQGRRLVTGVMREGAIPIADFLRSLEARPCVRVPGAAVFMTSDPEGVPPVLLHHLKHNKVLHERVVIMSVVGEEVPYVPEAERATVETLAQGFVKVVAHYGFMEFPDVPAVLAGLGDRGLALKPMDTTYYLGRETLLPSGPARMARWRKRLFIVMARNAQSASSFFSLPPNRVVEMGAQVQL